tara:strand:- start:90 stop:962 length:873 start_codon:yes stop_codon:yes gene_type:complete
MQTAAAALQVAQTAKMNRSLNELNQISAAQAQIANENLIATRQVSAGINTMTSLQQSTLQEQQKIRIAQEEIAHLTRETRKAIEDVEKEIQELNKTVEEGNKKAQELLIESKIQNALTQVQIDNDTLRFKIESNEKELSKLEKNHFSSMMEVIYNASEEIKEITKSDKHNIEIFFQLNSLIKGLKDAGVSTEKVDDLDTKASIGKLLNQTDTAMKDCVNSFSEEESQDLEDILDILADDEEGLSAERNQKIEENNLKIQAINKKIKKLEENILKAQNEVEILRPIIIDKT